MPGKGAQREWTIRANEFGEIDRDELAQRMLEVGTVLATVGGTFAAAARRVEEPEVDENDRPTGRTFWLTEEIVIQWSSFAPGRPFKPERESHVEGGDIDEEYDEDPAEIDTGTAAFEESEMRDDDEAAVDAELDEERELEPTES